MITERLLQALQHIESLSPDMQDELAEQIEEMTEPLEPLELSPEGQPQSEPPPLAVERLPESVRVALALGGAWSDLQVDDEFAALDRIRHATPPS
ncbi:MAG TPA: hypothetical protein VMV29_10140 [Ktedonobacterales bacterium]|nr:hypothetical protein [Ktedonobacterales bacterium]